MAAETHKGVTALRIRRADNVATCITAQRAGETAVCACEGETEAVPLREDIPFGHKFALRDIRKGEKILKYGCPIGIAAQDIVRGSHVHVHNVSSLRCG